METADPGEVAATIDHVTQTIGDPSSWSEWPGGWPDDIESALVDAIFSARAVYASTNGKGVRTLVSTWRSQRNRTVFSLNALIAEIEAVGPMSWAAKFGNRQLSPSRRSDAPEGPTKAAAVLEAARTLQSVGVNVASEIDLQNVDLVKTSLRLVSGIGYATSNYFLILLGLPGVKPDRMIKRFLLDSTGRRSIGDRAAERLTQAVADEFGVQDFQLDHAIWRFESTKARNRGVGTSPD